VTANPARFYKGNPVSETDFRAGKGLFVELARRSTSRPTLVLCQGHCTDNKTSVHFLRSDSVPCGPDEEEFTCHVRFAHAIGAYESVDTRFGI
jgi:hypothetical protein